MNRESRYEALKFYVMIHGAHKFCLAFDNDRDTIYGVKPRSPYLHGDLSLKLFEQKEFEYLSIGKGRRVNSSHNTVRIKSLAVDESGLEYSGRAKEWLGLDELIIVLPSSIGFPRLNLGGSSPGPVMLLGRRREDGEVQREFVREMESWVRREQRKNESERKEFKIPAVSAVQWGTLQTEFDFFCVPLTPLSLRKDEFHAC